MKLTTQSISAGFGLMFAVHGTISNASTQNSFDIENLRDHVRELQSQNQSHATRQESVEGVGAILHTLTSLIRNAKIAQSYAVVDIARDLQSEIRIVYLALEDDDLELAKDQMKQSLYTLRILERKASLSGEDTILQDIEVLQRQFFYSLNQLNQDSDGSSSEDLPRDTPTTDRVDFVTLQSDTLVKTSSIQSSRLSSKEKCALAKGTILTGDYLGMEANHFQLRLVQDIASCPLMKKQTIIYIYKDHASIDRVTQK